MESTKGRSFGFSIDMKLVVMLFVDCLIGVSGILLCVSINRLGGRLATARGSGGPFVVDLSRRPTLNEPLPFLINPVLMNAAGLGFSPSKTCVGVAFGR